MLVSLQQDGCAVKGHVRNPTLDMEFVYRFCYVHSLGVQND